MGLRLTPIVKLLTMRLPQRCGPSRATVGRWVEHARRRAGGILAVLDRVCQAGVWTLCLDEMFFHQEPGVVAVEPHSMAWVAGQRGPDRPGDSWYQWLRQWPRVARVVSDAGTGLARGVKLLNEARAAAPEPGQAPVAPVQVGVEVLHTERARQRVVSRRWAQAEKLLDTAAQAEQQVAPAKQRGIDARGAKRSAPWTRPYRGTRRWKTSGRPWPACGPTGSSMTGPGRRRRSPKPWEPWGARPGAKCGVGCTMRGP